MSNTLVIVESPSKCKKIETYLGPGYKVIASFGHLRNIGSIRDIDVENNFNTKYSIIQDELKLKQIEKIRTEINNASDVVIATDDDREGEAIGWHICDLYKLPLNTKRIIFHEITESAIQRAISYPKVINMDLVNSQRARQILDMLVGFTISPILWNGVSKTHESSLSAGRCQTPALRIVYDNYLNIKNSPGKMIFNTFGYFTNLNLMFDLNKSFKSSEEVLDFLEMCKKWSFIFSRSEPKKVIKKQPEPLVTSSLQQLASNELNLSPKETMKYAQQLYENGYITYMRSDSKKYSREFVDIIKQNIKSSYGDNFISKTIDNLIIGNAKEPIAQKKNIPPPQEAHEAIRPVDINKKKEIVSNETNTLHAKCIKLYELIWKRTMESCMSSAQYNSISAKIKAPMNSEFVYKTEQVVFLGWKIIMKKEEELNSSNYQYIKSLKQSIDIVSKKIESKFALVELKSHYSEAMLVKLLEEKGIGRPSTFASLIDKIQERKYVQKENISGREIKGVDYSLHGEEIVEIVSSRDYGVEKNKLVIQPLGIIVIEFLLKNISGFFDYDYTKNMENDLDQIANGKHIWSDLCINCNEQLTKINEKLIGQSKFSLMIDERHSLIIGKYGPVVKSVDLNNKSVKFIPVKKGFDIEPYMNVSNKCEISLANIIDETPNVRLIGKYKGQELFIKNGKYGVYAEWGNETKNLKNEFGTKSINEIDNTDVISYLNKDNKSELLKPAGLIRELNKHISIRVGKYGDYIFYKKTRNSKVEFYKLIGFEDDYKTCDSSLLLNWLKQKYKIE